MHRLTELWDMTREEQIRDFLHTYIELAKVAEDREEFVDALEGEPYKQCALKIKLRNCFERYVNPIGLKNVYYISPGGWLTDEEEEFVLSELRNVFC